MLCSIADIFNTHDSRMAIQQIVLGLAQGGTWMNVMDVFSLFCHSWYLSFVVDITPFQFEVDTTAIAGASLWALGLYIGLPTLKTWIADRLTRWFNFAERSLYPSDEEFERTRPARESQNLFYASLFSPVPFLILGVIGHYSIALTLGRSWAVSFGIMLCMGLGIYQLGRQTGSEDP
jgi:hypothetical protein